MMSFDDKGNLYLATRQGLVKIERKLMRSIHNLVRYNKKKK